jgi:hypothetical protein
MKEYGLLSANFVSAVISLIDDTGIGHLLDRRALKIYLRGDLHQDYEDQGVGPL